MKIAEFQKIGEAIETFRIAMNENAGVSGSFMQVDVPNWAYWLIARFYFSTEAVTVNLFTDCDKPQRSSGEYSVFCCPYGLQVINPHKAVTKMCFRSFHHAEHFLYFMHEIYESFLASHEYKKIGLNEWMCGFDRDRLPAQDVMITEDDT